MTILAETTSDLDALAARVESLLNVAFAEADEGCDGGARWTGDTAHRTYADGTTRTAVYVDATVPGAGFGAWAAFNKDGVLIVSEALEEVL